MWTNYLLMLVSVHENSSSETLLKDTEHFF